MLKLFLIFIKIVLDITIKVWYKGVIRDGSDIKLKGFYNGIR
jgi:hypothetical protein